MPVFLLALTVIAVHVSGVTGCRCVNNDAQTKYCQSDFAIVARVTAITVDGLDLPNADRTYYVDVSKVYKGNVFQGRAEVRTSGIASLCGVNLDRNTYLLNGHFRNGEMWIDSCNMITSNPLIGPATSVGFDPSFDCRCKKENISLEQGQPKPKRVCDLGNRLRCPPLYYGAPRKLAECRYIKMRDDCDWRC